MGTKIRKQLVYYTVATALLAGLLCLTSGRWNWGEAAMYVVIYESGAFSVWNAFWGRQVYTPFVADRSNLYARTLAFSFGVTLIVISIYLMF
ncbi:MAG: hypothetical protein ABF335_13350 [Alphaproteobacteria bacterium]